MKNKFISADLLIVLYAELKLVLSNSLSSDILARIASSTNILFSEKNTISPL